MKQQVIQASRNAVNARWNKTDSEDSGERTACHATKSVHMLKNVSIKKCI